jgi:hypothetical protein
MSDATASDATASDATASDGAAADLPAAQRVADVLAFATLGTLATTQDVTHGVLAALRDTDAAPDLVAEETFCLVATATARAAQVGLGAEPAVAAVAARTLLRLPFTYREYLLGAAMVAGAGAPEGFAEAGEQVRGRLERKLAFYTTHLPDGRFPGPHALRDVMELWMGRVSPPGLPVTPQARLAELGLVDDVLAHLKVVLAHGRRGG